MEWKEIWGKIESMPILRGALEIIKEIALSSVVYSVFEKHGKKILGKIVEKVTDTHRAELYNFIQTKILDPQRKKLRDFYETIDKENKENPGVENRAVDTLTRLFLAVTEETDKIKIFTILGDLSTIEEFKLALDFLDNDVLKQWCLLAKKCVSEIASKTWKGGNEIEKKGLWILFGWLALLIIAYVSGRPSLTLFIGLGVPLILLVLAFFSPMSASVLAIYAGSRRIVAFIAGVQITTTILLTVCLSLEVGAFATLATFVVIIGIAAFGLAMVKQEALDILAKKGKGVLMFLVVILVGYMVLAVWLPELPKKLPEASKRLGIDTTKTSTFRGLIDYALASTIDAIKTKETPPSSPAVVPPAPTYHVSEPAHQEFDLVVGDTIQTALVGPGTHHVIVPNKDCYVVGVNMDGTKKGWMYKAGIVGTWNGANPVGRLLMVAIFPGTKVTINKM